MKKRRILLVDSEPNNIRILKNHFVQANYDVEQALNAIEAFEKLKANRYSLVLSEVSGPGMDGYKLLEYIQREASISDTPVVFLTHKSDVWHRVKSFKLGAKDYIVKPMHVKEVIARVNMVLSRIEKRNDEEIIANRKFVGRLEDLGVSELIQAFGLERKTGILRVYNINGLNGQIYFKNGAVVNAVSATLRAEEAVYKMMGWRKGRFSMFFCPVDVADEISVSNMGLLLQGAKRMEQREELLKELPPLEAIVVTTSNFKKILEKQELAPDLENFLNLFDGERSLGRIIDESDYDDITALKRVLKLYRLGFLHVLRPFAKAKDEEEELEPVADAILNEEEPNMPFVPAEEELVTMQSKEELETLLPEETISENESEKIAEPITEAPTEFVPLLNQEKMVDASLAPPSETNVTEETPEDEEALQRAKEILEHPADALLDVEVEEQAPKKEAEMAEEEIQEMEMQASPPTPIKSEKREKKVRGTLLILSARDSDRREFMQILTDGKIGEKVEPAPGLSDIYFGTTTFKGASWVNLISLSLEKEFTPLVDYFSSSLVGCIILVNSLKINWSYYSYLLTILRQSMDIPILVLFHHVNAQMESENVHAYARKLNLSTGEEIRFLEKFEPISCKRLMFSIFDLVGHKDKIRIAADTSPAV